MFRFLHAADVHLDSPFLGLGRYENAPEEEMRNALRDALRSLVALAIKEQCAFLVIAGDLYDGTKKDIASALFFSEQMKHLDDKGIDVFIVYGNHDAETQLKNMRWPRNVRIFGSKKAETIELEEIGVAIHGQSFGKRDEKRNLAAGYPEHIPGKINIGILHTALEGHDDHEPYAPCSLDDLTNKGYDYWALGHVHEYSVRSEDPYVVYPGNLQGRSVREIGEKGAVLVTVDDGNLTIERHVLDAARWDSREIDLSSVDSLVDMDNKIQHAIEQVAIEAGGRLVAIRLTLTGRTSLHSKLQREEMDIADEIRVSVHGMGENVWVEKIKFETAPAYSIEDIAKRDDAVGDLVSRLADAKNDEALVADLKADFAAVLKKLPSAAKSNGSEIIDLAKGENFDPLIEYASSYLISQLAEIDR
jgi:DNA repair protein SbcD/Mre11